MRPGSSGPYASRPCGLRLDGTLSGSTSSGAASADAAGMRWRDRDRLVTLVAADGLVGANLVEAFPLDVPAALPELEEGRRVPRELEQLESWGLELDADQGQEMAGLTVAGPDHLIMP